MNEHIFGFISLVVFIVITFLANYHGNTGPTQKITGYAGMFGLVLLVWWIIKFVLLGILVQ